MIEVRSAHAADLLFCREREFSLKEMRMLQAAQEEGQVLVALLHGERVGYLRWEKLWGRIPYMNVINVLPAAQGSGVGTALLAEAVSSTA
jgi:ribosomal protein S18 acetylase RimI-like enzyme